MLWSTTLVRRFDDVVRVVIDGGDGNDEIIIADTFTRKATIRGGAGRDNLISYADAEIYFDGGTGPINSSSTVIAWSPSLVATAMMN